MHFNDFNPKNLKGNLWFKPRFIILLHTKPHFVCQNISQVFILLGMYNFFRGNLPRKPKSFFARFLNMFMTHKSNGNRKRSLVRFIFTFISLFNFAGFFTVHESSTNRETVWNKGNVSYYLHFKPIPCNKNRISLCSHFYPVVITGIMFSLQGMLFIIIVVILAGIMFSLQGYSCLLPVLPPTGLQCLSQANSSIWT